MSLRTFPRLLAVLRCSPQDSATATPITCCAQSGLSAIADAAPGSRSSTSTCAGRGARAAPSASSETLQNLDGYDVIETVAHQPWPPRYKLRSYRHAREAVDARSNHLMGRRRCCRRDPRPRRSGRHPRDGALGSEETAGGAPREPPWVHGGGVLRVDPGAHGKAPRTRLSTWRRERRSRGAPPYPVVGTPRTPTCSCTRSTCRCSSPASGPTSRPAPTAPRPAEHFSGTGLK